MSDELKENIRNLKSYYDQHGIESMIQSHPSFVAEDFGKLLTELEKELEK